MFKKIIHRSLACSIIALLNNKAQNVILS